MTGYDFNTMPNGYSPLFSMADFGVQNVPTSQPVRQPTGLSALLSQWGATDQYNDIGQKTGQGWGGAALGAANGIFNAYMGLKQYGLAKDQFAESKKQFGLNYDAQAATTNASLADRQRARLSADPNGYQSVADYMAAYGIKPRG